ncbi:MULTISPECIES: cytochrome P450 [unclassified Crossiella]|uniref:cytochrome P450 n=1 Tax=unclassified Crossiella TaxID=2620835 RepID=UPI001FFE4058|nr:MULTISPECIES: cytochrome P450 [unclassified Crossiella]MCK2242061.1 cytochrome P450 [Crossiella sp. S99.2]MCK2255964.1 cytochrome P450 [Crossiella sp. S99.1]
MTVLGHLRSQLTFLSHRAALWGASAIGDPGARLVRRGTADPYPLYEEIREAGPLVRSRFGFYVGAGHELSARLLRDERFGMPGPHGVFPQRAATEPVHPIEDSFLMMDPPDHTRLRRLVAPWFTSRTMARRAEEIERIVADCLDEFEDAGEVDLIPLFANRVPVQVICDLLGVPAPEHERFRGWANRIAPAFDGVNSVGEFERLRQVMLELQEFFTELIAFRRRHPAEDMLSGLVHAKVDGESLSTKDLLATSGLLLLAGFGTTVNLIGKGALGLLTHPDALGHLRRDPGLAAAVVEETLRYDPPVHLTSRFARKDAEVAGFRIRRGEQIVLSLAGANRDPAVFDHPDQFDPTRPNAREHLAFSGGIHFCVGAALARLEAGIALRALFQRHPRLELAGAPERGDGRTLPMLTSLPVHCPRRAASSAA